MERKMGVHVLVFFLWGTEVGRGLLANYMINVIDLAPRNRVIVVKLVQLPQNPCQFYQTAHMCRLLHAEQDYTLKVGCSCARFFASGAPMWSKPPNHPISGPGQI